MKAKLKAQMCEISGCNQKAICAWQPKGRMDKKIWICRRHQEQHDVDGFLWKLAGIRKPEKVRRPKLAVQKHRPQKEGKPKWQEILDKWFAKGKYPMGKFMSPKRWEYWFSIGGKKPEGDSRKFNPAIKTTLAEANRIAAAVMSGKIVPGKTKKLRAKVRRKKSY